MLKSIYIENYAIIDSLRVDFDKGLSIITGETGAGKSILLGALGLALGQRADSLSIKNKDKNCIIELTFALEAKKWQAIFEDYDVDFDEISIFRRIINSSGKSRAFINDIPVAIAVLKSIGEQLVDIHSQHQNLLLKNTAFQIEVVDTVAKNKDVLQSYKTALGKYKLAEKELNDLEAEALQKKEEFDYLNFQYEQLESANLVKGEQEDLEKELVQLTHAEEIKSAYSSVGQILADNEPSAVLMLGESVALLQKIANLSDLAQSIVNRIESCKIEIADIAYEINIENDKIAVDAGRQEFVEGRLDTIYALQQKHRVASCNELIEIKDKIEAQLQLIGNFDNRLSELGEHKEKCLELLRDTAKKLSDSRKKVLPTIEKHVTQMLQLLGVPNTTFVIKLLQSDSFLPGGTDDIQFLFSANKEIPPQDIAKVASGGEISRLMLSLKSLVIESGMFPTIVFDEIDTGISGDVADKTGEIMYRLGQNSQIINITHLPQIASKGNAHYFVYKEDKGNTTTTNISRLTKEERVLEIAKMLSGSDITQAAIENARELLK